MFKSRFAITIAIAVLSLIAAFAVEAGNSRMTVSSNALSRANIAGQPSGNVPLAGVEASDYVQRHSELLRPGNVVDRSDYFLRHSSAAIASATGASDWFERHPESMNTANPVDLSDYFLRHSSTVKSNDVAAPGDYWQRHPELLYSGKTADLSDWFQRHPGTLGR